MKRSILALLFCLLTPLAHAWNAAGHRLVSLIAWEQLSQGSREKVITALQQHPDYPRWQEKSKSDQPSAHFAEASTWADSIRNDPRFYDERRESPKEPVPGLPDNAKHKRWHYVDLDAKGQAIEGEVDKQIERLSQLLRSTANSEEISWALPWLLHLVADIHQPLHVGYAHDEGGNLTEIENPLRRQPFTNLHSYWDERPGPSSLRGQRLENRANELVDRYKAPKQGNVALWRKESHALLKDAYPETAGSLLPIVTKDFDRKTQEIADRRISEAGYRLGRLLEDIFSKRVSRETR